MGLAHESSFLGSLLAQLAEGVFALDGIGRIIYVNAAASRLFGWPAAELCGRPITELMRPGDADVACLLNNQHTSDRTCCCDDKYFLRADGTAFPASCTRAPVVEGGAVVGAVTIFRDVTEEKQSQEQQQALITRLREAQEQLLQSEKMASIGQLAAGVAHEINNPVGYIGSNLTTLKQYVEDMDAVLAALIELRGLVAEDNPARQRADQVFDGVDLAYLRQDVRDLLMESSEGVDRVRQIVQDLKDFSHVDDGTWAWADLRRGVDSTLNIVHNELKYRADVVKDYADLPPVECRIAQINQVVMNLLVNAAHAIDGHGTIHVRIGPEGDDWVWVEVADSGCGIAPENLKRIFDPFFTTKPVGKGTGLGLSLAYSIVNKHHGRIEVDSELGVGTRFRVWLPVRQPEPMVDATVVEH